MKGISESASRSLTVERPRLSESRMRGGWRMLARCAWLITAGLSVLYLCLGVPEAFAQLTQLCPAVPCPDPLLSPANAAALRGFGLTPAMYAGYMVGLRLLFALAAVVVGSLIFARRSDDPMALVVAVVLVAYAALGFGISLDAVTAMLQPLRWLFQAVLYIGNIGLVVLFFIFPDGRFVPRWTASVALLLMILGVPVHFFGESLLAQWLRSPAGFPLSIGIVAVAVWSQIYRYRRVSTLTQRQQTKWVVLGIAVAMAGAQGVYLSGLFLNQPHVVLTMAMNTINVASVLMIPLSIGIATLRHHLFDVDVLISRTLVYGVLTASVAALYIVIVGTLSLLLQDRFNLLVSLLATGLIAVLFQPMRARLQRTVNRFMFGERDEPYVVLARLGQRLQDAIAPEAILSTIVETVAQALKLPYVAIALDQDGIIATVSATGRPVPDTMNLPLSYQGDPIGQLIVGPRTPGEPFSRADRRLLDDLTHQAGVAAHMVRLMTELQRANVDLHRSRERLIGAREEERRRLRRDLHDGLGPQLASLTLTVAAVRELLAHDPAAADALLGEVATHAQTAIIDIRRVIYDLRPPALDDLGLVAAVREQAANASRNGLLVTLVAPESIPPLPAAIDVAAYRIAMEALTNVRRHARARTCTITLQLSDALTIQVRDDGRGLPPEQRAGVGLQSMRERAEELGGSLVVESLARGGTLVCARLPLPEEEV